MINSTPTNKFVTDTMGLILRMEHRRLSRQVKNIFDKAQSGETIIYIPGIVFSEILYLSEKQRIEISINEVADYLERYKNYKEYPLNFDVIKSAARITDIRELHDRLIAGTSLFLNLPLITNDPVIQASEFVDTVW
jgi:predicted nucleic acid-binding protein